MSTVPDVETRRTDAGDDIFHWFCCDENRAVCGVDLTDTPFGRDPLDLMCVVCDDEDLPCPDCGELP